MDFTVFACGVFYERFARGGLIGLGIGNGGGAGGGGYQGAYLMDVGEGTAQVVETTNAGQPCWVCLTSVYDLARFLVAALELRIDRWPEVFRWWGDRRTVAEIVQWGETVRGGMLFFLYFPFPSLVFCLWFFLVAFSSFLWYRSDQEREK